MESLFDKENVEYTEQQASQREEDEDDYERMHNAGYTLDGN